MAIKVRDFNFLDEQKPYVYKDLHLDLTSRKGDLDVFNQLYEGPDIVASIDYQAIKNSLYNLFNTQKGQRFLFPNYGADLRKYLFMPVNDITGRILGTDIKEAIKRSEPRVEVLEVNVEVFNDLSLFKVIISIFCEQIGSSISLGMDVQSSQQSNSTREFVVYSIDNN